METEVHLSKKYDYRISVDIWSFFSGKTKYLLNNLKERPDESIDFNDAKEMTLYKISVSNKRKSFNSSSVLSDTTEVPFSKEQSDTLFILTDNFLNNVSFDKYDTIGKMIPIIRDDANARIELNSGGKTLSATLISINNPAISTKQLDTLLNFIQKFKLIRRK